MTVGYLAVLSGVVLVGLFLITVPSVVARVVGAVLVLEAVFHGAFKVWKTRARGGEKSDKSGKAE